MRLSAYNPVALIFGPVFQKEVRAAGRRRSTYVFRALYAAGLVALVAIAYIGIRSSAEGARGVRRLQELQQLAPSVGLVIMWFQFVALALAAPIFTGAAIADERRARTLATLLTTPLSAAQIIWGKLSSRLVQLTILSLLALPLLLAIRVFGGLDAGVVIAATVVSLSVALLGAALGLMYSTWHRRGMNAAVFGLLTLVLVQGAPSAVEGILVLALNETLYTGGPREYPFHENVLATNAAAVMGFISATAVTGQELRSFSVSLGAQELGYTPFTIPMWTVNAVYNVVMTGAAVMASVVSLRRTMRREGAAEGTVAPPARRRRRAAAAAPPTIPAPTDNGEAPPVESLPAEPEPDTADDSRDRDSREVSDRPVLWREVRQATFGSRRNFLVVAVLVAAGMAYLYYEWGIHDEGLNMVLAIVGAIAIMVQSIFMTTGSIAHEREARTWEVLLTTPLSGRAIIFGKAAGALRAQWFIPAVVLGHFVLAAAGGYVSPLFPLVLFLIYLGPTLFFTASGQLFSLIFRKGVTAAACNLGLGLMLWIGSWVAVGLAGWFSDVADSDWFDYSTYACYCMNPVALTGSAGGGMVRYIRGSSLSGVYAIYGADQLTLTAPDFLAVVVGVFAVYAAGAAVAVGIALANFRSLSGRSS